MTLVIWPVLVIGFGTAIWLMMRSANTAVPGPIKKMAAAGTFYPAEAARLTSDLDNYLNMAVQTPLTGHLRIIIAPHAGLVYSGRTAAAAYKQLIGSNFTKAIIIGPSHYFRFDHAAILTEGNWETPLGNVNIDSDLGKKILSPEQNILEDKTVYEKEHSLEMQTIFLKKMVPNIKIVPILLSSPTEEVMAALAYKIALNIDERTLVVISSDMSHYPNYETANRVDGHTLEEIRLGKWPDSTSEPGVETLACGADPIRLALKIAELLKFDLPQVIKYENSGDVTGDKDRVVGYAAIGITGDTTKFITPIMSKEAREEALAIAKQTLADWVTNKKTPGEIRVVNRELLDPVGAFVTLRKNGQLRGCIGEFSPTKPLVKVITEKTIAAASADPRFNPVTPDELEAITLEISAMSPKIKITDWRQINLGIDGVVVVSGNKSGTYLPQVASETGWNLEELLSHLCVEKAGLDKDCYLDKSTEIFTYEAQVF
jgi:MEMO1 family protein